MKRPNYLDHSKQKDRIPGCYLAKFLIRSLIFLNLFFGCGLGTARAGHVPKTSSSKQVQAYLQLMYLLTKPAYHKVLEPFIKNLKISKDKDLFAITNITDFADEHDIPFIMLLDWKTEIVNLDWRITTAAKKNFNLVVMLPGAAHWGPDRSISYTGVLEAYQKALKKSGLQMGFLDSESDEYLLLVFKISKKNQVRKAVELTGFKYYEQ